MKKFFTLALTVALTSAAAQAQTKIATLGFEPGDSKYTTEWALTPGGTYGDWVNRWVGTGDFEGYEDEWVEPSKEDAHSGEYCMMMSNSFEKDNCGRWERGFKVGNLKVKDNTVYRVSFWVKSDNGNGKIKSAMGIGREYFDTDFLSSTGANFMYETTTTDEWKRFSYLTYFSNKAYYDERAKTLNYPVTLPDGTVLAENADAGYPDKYFAIFNLYSADTYYLDDIEIEEGALIAGAYCGYEAIKIDFGFPTNIAALIKENGGPVMLPTECATVKINGEVQEIISVELKDGALYIFPDASIDENSEVVVSFNAAGTGIKYSGDATPADGKDVPSFTDEPCYFDENIEATSEAYSEPKLVSSTPEDGSFELDEYITDFSFTFDRDINLEQIGAQLMVNGKAINLKNVSEGKVGRTANFKYESGDLPKNAYSVYVFDVTSALGIDAIDEFVVSFETGKVSVAGITYTDVASAGLTGEENGIPEGWSCMVGGENWNGGEAWEGGANCRSFILTNAATNEPTVTFYLCDREGYTYLMYGDQEGYNLALPAGNVEFAVSAIGWESAARNVEFVIEDMEGNIIGQGNGSPVSFADNGNKVITTPARITAQFNVATAGNYILKIRCTNGGYNAIQVIGYDIKTYEIGQGETADNQTVVDGSFTDVANDGVPAAGAGWHVYENDNMHEPGSVAGQRTRFFTGMGVKNLPNAFYNRNLGGDPHVFRLTYGETKHADGSVCEDEEGNVAEKALELDVARYNLSWYICNWKGAENTYYFKILDEDGEEVYSREDVCTINIDGDRNKAVEAQKIEFSWTPKNAGKYIMEWYMTGESMVGGIKVEKMGSLAVFWHTQLNEAIKAAEDERANAEGEEFAGATRDALDKAIAEAKTVTYHTGKEYTAAMERLAEYVKAMADRRQAIADYNAAYTALNDQIAEMEGSKYEALDSYNAGKALVAQYDGVEGWTIDNETLLPVVDQFKTLKALNANLMKIGVPAFTNQIKSLVDTYNKVSEFVPEEQEAEGAFELMLNADEEVTDNQDLVKLLQMATTAQVYKAIANGYTFQGLEFPDEEPSEDNPYVVDPLDLSGFIRNAVFYAHSPEREIHNSDDCNKYVPGWEFDAPNGISLNWGWGGWDNENAPVAPVNVTDQHLGTKWATDFEVWQDVTNIPVGIYAFGASTADDSNLENEELEERTKSYLYVVIGDETYTQPFNIETSSSYRQESECRVEDITITEGNARVGAKCDVDAGFAAIDNAKLLMSAPVPGFDYAAAAKQMDAAFATSVKGIESAPAANIANTQYFDLNGRKVVNAKGILIRIDTYTDGSQRTVKVLRK